jgi:lyso-ornithine lipid O-acyltransferase
MANIRALYTIIHVCSIAIGGAILLWALGRLGKRSARQAWQLKCYRAICKAWRINVTIKGELAPAPTLLISNHCSYVDVFILGSLGQMRFTPKSDVKSWPIISPVIQAFDVIFVDRSPTKAKEVQAALHDALAHGDRLCIFPEGTTNDGRSLKPYKSSMLSLAEHHEGLRVQPLVVRYVGFDNRPVDEAAWEQIAWYGDADLVTHLWGFSKARSVKVEVTCLAPMTIAADGNRKVLSSRAYEATRQLLGYDSL